MNKKEQTLPGKPQNRKNQIKAYRANYRAAFTGGGKNQN